MFIDPGASGSHFSPQPAKAPGACHRFRLSPRVGPAKATTTGARRQVQSSQMEQGRAAVSSSSAFMPSPTAPKRVLTVPQPSTQPLEVKPQRALTLPQLPSSDPGCIDFLPC